MNFNDNNVCVRGVFFFGTDKNYHFKCLSPIQFHSRRPLVTSPKEGKCPLNVKSGDVRILTAGGGHEVIYFIKPRETVTELRRYY